MRSLAVRLGLALAIGAGACPAVVAEPRFDAVVTRVSDGDTVWVRRDGDRGRPVKLRLQGIDAPERCQAGGPAASQALSVRVLGQRVQVLPRARDAHGRLVVDLRLARDGADIGAWMVGAGHAWSSRFRGNPGPYAREEREARVARRGLFRESNPEPPAQFRRRHGPCD